MSHSGAGRPAFLRGSSDKTALPMLGPPRHAAV